MENTEKKVAPSAEHREPRKEDCANASVTNNHRGDNSSVGADNQGELTNITREELEENIARWTGFIESDEILLKAAKERKKAVGKDKQKKEQAEADIEKLEAKIKDREELVESAREILRGLPPEVLPDEDQPWFERVYANCHGYLVKDEDGNFKFTNEGQTGRHLREWGINDRRDTQTTSPLDRAFTAIHIRHHVDHYGALAGYRPGSSNTAERKY